MGPERLPAMCRYIADQEVHHRTESFQNEIRRVLKAHDVEIDERYFWD